MTGWAGGPSGLRSTGLHFPISPSMPLGLKDAPTLFQTATAPASYKKFQKRTFERILKLQRNFKMGRNSKMDRNFKMRCNCEVAFFPN